MANHDRLNPPLPADFLMHRPRFARHRRAAISRRVLRCGNGLSVGAAAMMGLAACHSAAESVAPPPPRDVIAPDVRLASPQSVSCTRTSSVSLTGTAVDNVGVTRITYRFDSSAETDVPVLAGSAIAFDTKITLPQGQSVLTVTAYDAAGNSARATATVRYSVSRLIAARDGMTPPNAIVVVDSSGDCRRQVATATDYTYDWPAYAWNATQTRLVFENSSPLVVEKHLYITGLDGEVAELVPGSLFEAEQWPQFTSDGQWVYFAVGSWTPEGAFPYAIWRIHPDGTSLQRMTPPGSGSASFTSPSPSPDGSRIVMITGTGIQIFNVATQSWTPLGVTGQSPRWSPTGNLIAFIDLSSRNDGLGVVAVVSTDGSGKRVISPNGVAYDRSVSWSRDGSSVLVQNYTSKRLEFINVTTTAVLGVPNTGSLFAPEW